MIRVLSLVCGFAVVWYVLVGAHRLGERDIRAWFNENATAISEGNVDVMCNGLSRDAVVIQRDGWPAPNTANVMNREEYCEQTRETLKQFESLRGILGRQNFSIRVDYEIDSIAFSPDRKEATVQGRSLVRFGGGSVQYLSVGTSQFVSELGRTKLARSDAQVQMTGPVKLMRQSDFFHK